MSSKSSKTTEQPTRDLPDAVTVGRVLRPHGLRGAVVIEALSDVAARFEPGSVLWAGEEGGAARALTVTGSRPFRSGRVLQLAGVEDRDAAEALRGAWLSVPRTEVPGAPEGTYYHFELLGCRCSTPEGGEGELGEVVDLVEDGGGLLLMIDDGRRILPVPFVQRFLREIDVKRGRIVLDLPPGLIEACASRS
jgi:16S rRNA processing protein RimM